MFYQFIPRCYAEMYVWLYLLIFLLIIYLYLKHELDYWKIRGVPYAKGKILVGNMGPSLIMTKSIPDIYSDLYKKFQQYKYCGFFQCRIPALLIIDLDVVKDVLIRNFNNFHDNSLVVDEKQDPILAKNPFFARGEKWKMMRGQLTPQFTAGKMKAMFPLLKEVGGKLIEYLDTDTEVTAQNGMDAKEVASKFTSEAVASCAFGLQGGAFVDPKAEFRELGKKIFRSSYLDIIITFLLLIFPEMAKIKLQKFLDDKISNTFKNIILENLKNRETKNVKRGDFLDVIAEMRDTTTSFDYNTDYMVAHALTFFIDGFETSSIVLQYVYYELGANSDVQKKLRDEIERVLSGNYENFTYDSLQDMKYLDMVVQETLRKYPPGTALMKECTETTMLEPAEVNGKPLLVEKGTQIYIPVLTIHHDPIHFPDPEKFDPERFGEEGKESRSKLSYLAFGEGPRMCLGRRYGIMQIKVAIVATIKNFEVKVDQKTKVPFELDPMEFLHAVKGGVWVNFNKLSKE